MMQTLSISFWEFLQKEKDILYIFFAYKSIQTSTIYFHRIFCCNQKLLGVWLSFVFCSDSVGIKKKEMRKESYLDCSPWRRGRTLDQNGGLPVFPECCAPCFHALLLHYLCIVLALIKDMMRYLTDFRKASWHPSLAALFFFCSWSYNISLSYES